MYARILYTFCDGCPDVQCTQCDDVVMGQSVGYSWVYALLDMNLREEKLENP